MKKKEQAELLIPLMKYYYPADHQLEARIQEIEEELNPPKEEPPKESPKSLLKNKSAMNQSMDLSERPKTPKPLDSSTLKPSAYAIKDL